MYLSCKLMDDINLQRLWREEWRWLIEIISHGSILLQGHKDKLDLTSKVDSNL